MTPVEKLVAAIAVLTAIQDDNTPFVMSGNRRAFNEHAVLHRTIDAQIDYMSDHLADLKHTTEQPSVYALALADAILGGEQ